MSETDQFWQYAKLPDRPAVFAWLVLTFVAAVIYFFPIARLVDACRLGISGTLWEVPPPCSQHGVGALGRNEAAY